MLRKIKGFTLVELLIVIAIIGILVTVALIAINPVRVIEDTRDAKYRSEMLQIKTALQLYFNELNTYPDDITDLETDYIRQLPDVADDATFDYGIDVPETDYDAGVSLNNPDDSDAATVTKCGTELAAGDFMICPD
ncbi:MAG: hypothetical protein A2Z42_00065 [Candidatus Woykebacteria bacterium RBG_19FT_COMBO_43_10]|uniref:Type II secretion system protein GspG C-terminal domain-containing protein n=1 Tax=Candidatus Woykebacteria bacterium RBG_19FT_COMBO_43_10 TaxID=1802598 RepID=A0A1G1WJY7_9BACT|nr:MAG: hypothetical protein A2Z42_00065 [Candidatus Woykebacteria bacterium RBG_19FT_COMBO_43_10]